MNTFITPKANAALQAIAEGRVHEVTRQMMDRLSKAKLIDITGTSNGWFVTEHGWNTLTFDN